MARPESAALGKGHIKCYISDQMKAALGDDWLQWFESLRTSVKTHAATLMPTAQTIAALNAVVSQANERSRLEREQREVVEQKNQRLEAEMAALRRHYGLLPAQRM